jgi:hypothetical protein
MPAGPPRHVRGALPPDVIVRARNRGLTEIPNNRPLARRRVNDSRDRIAPQVEGSVARAKEQGTLRPDVEGTDAIFIQLALAAVMDSSRDVAPELSRRYLAIFLDGLRADRGPLTPTPRRSPQRGRNPQGS